MPATLQRGHRKLCHLCSLPFMIALLCKAATSSNTVGRIIADRKRFNRVPLVRGQCTRSIKRHHRHPPCTCSRPSIRVLGVLHSRSSCGCIRPATLSGWPVHCQWLLCWKGRRGTDLDPHLSHPASYWCVSTANTHRGAGEIECQSHNEKQKASSSLFQKISPQ
jgi:hypothetical protein